MANQRRVFAPYKGEHVSRPQTKSGLPRGAYNIKMFYPNKYNISLGSHCCSALIYVVVWKSEYFNISRNFVLAKIMVNLNLLSVTYFHDSILYLLLFIYGLNRMKRNSSRNRLEG